MSSHPATIPNGWCLARLGDVCNVAVGFAFKSAEFSTSGIRLLRGENIEPGSLRWTNVRFWPAENVEGFEHLFLTEGDVILAMDRPVISTGLKLARVRADDVPSLLVQRVARLRAQSSTTNSFVHYTLQSQEFISHLLAGQTGTQLPHVSSAAIGRYPVRLPPLPEQQRIVSKIEELFSDLDAGVSALERAKANLKRYRASVLKAAVEGRLTNLRQVPLVPLSELIEGLGQGWSPKCELNRDPDPNEWAIIKTTAVQSMAYSDQEAKPLPPAFSPRPDIEIRQGDILMTRKGPRSRCGVACLVRSTRHRLMVCDTVYRFRCRESQVLPEYLELALNSPTVIEEINKRKSGISESGLSLTHKKIGEVLIPTPAREEQSVISNEVARLLSLLESMLRTIASSDARANRLKQSILKLAFEGGLMAPLADQSVHSSSTSASNDREE